MSNQHRIVTIPASSTDIVNNIFQMFTIVVVGIFSVVAVLHTAAQII